MLSVRSCRRQAADDDSGTGTESLFFKSAKIVFIVKLYFSVLPTCRPEGTCPVMNAMLFLALSFYSGQAQPLQCAQAVVERGLTRGGPAIVQSFDVVNRGTTDLKIVNAQPSCGCLAPTTNRTTLKPGESANIQIKIGTLSQPEGDNLWTVRLFYRVAGSETDLTLDLQVKAKLQREVGTEPAALRLAGKPGLAHEVTITDRRAKPMELTRVETTSPSISATLDPAWQSTPDGWVRKVRVMLTQECPSGKHEEALQILSDDPDYREMRISITAVRTDKKRFEVAPGQLTLEANSTSSNASATALIRDYEGQPIEIEQVEAEDPALAATFAPGSRSTASVRVIVNAGQAPARWSTLRVYVKQPVAQTVTIPVFCPAGK